MQSAFFAGQTTYEIHTGYQYTKTDSFASLSDANDHKAEAIAAALNPKIKELVEKGIKKVVICIDGPTSQYRNSKNVYLMKKLAMKHNISIRLLYTEAGHGKSPCDGVGGNLKTEVENAVLAKIADSEPVSLHTAEDIKNVLEEKANLTYDIKIHNKGQIKEIKESIPKLGPLNAALKIHEIFINSNGKIKKKESPHRFSLSRCVHQGIKESNTNRTNIGTIS